MTNFEKPLHFDGYLPTAAGKPIAPAVKTAALLAVLVAYALGFAILYPLVEASVSKSVAEGNDPALIQFVAP